ncbi:MAG: SH3 domain-containing protein [Clostridia bacterium]|nr:SH3 domain-containing protein [Clostridia bacterium]
MKKSKRVMCTIIAGFVVSSVLTYPLSVNAEGETTTAYTTDYLRVRTEPNTDAGIIDVVVPDTPVQRTEKLDNGWSEVIYNGEVRYMYSEYLTETEDEENIYDDINEKPVVSSETEAEILPGDFQVDGIEYWGGYRWAYYSELVLPGGGLDIPGRYTDYNGYVCDENDYICLASDSLPKGTVVSTPFGKDGKVYDCGCGADDILDVYCSW